MVLKILKSGALKAAQACAEMAGLRLFRYRNNYNQDGLFTLHSDDFRRTKEFRSAYERGLKTVTLDPRHEWRVHIGLWCAANAAKLEGDFVECGVFVGFMSSAIMHRIDWDSLAKTFYLLDTFEGPQVSQFTEEEIRRGRKDEVDMLRKIGGYDYTFEMVKKNFSEWKNVKLIKGLVPDSLAECGAKKIAYLHLDMNASLPETAALRYFWDKLVPGAMVLLDDYAFAGFEEQHRAFDQLAKEIGFEIASLPTGQGLIIRGPKTPPIQP